MHRIDGDGAVNSRFVGQTASQEGTVVTPEILNAFQEEICNVVEGAGLTLEKTNNAQLLAAIQTLGVGGSGGSGPLRISLPGAVVASSARVVSLLGGVAGEIIRIGGRISGSGTATITVKADGSTVASFDVGTTNSSDYIVSGGSLANTSVTELSIISIYVTAASDGAEDLMMFITVEPSESE